MLLLLVYIYSMMIDRSSPTRRIRETSAEEQKMRTIQENEKIFCDHCELDLTGRDFEDVHTRDNKNFCGYECIESAYAGTEITTENDFLNSKI